MGCSSIIRKSIFVLLPLFLLVALSPFYFYQVSIQVKMDNRLYYVQERQNILTDIPTPAGYVVYTEGCRIIDIPAFNWEAYKNIRTEKIDCKDQVIDKIGNTFSLSTKMFAKPESQRPNCCYRVIWRQPVDPKNLNHADDMFVKSNSCVTIPISDPIVIPGEFLEIFCEFPGQRKPTQFPRNISEINSTKFKPNWNATMATAFPLRSNSKTTRNKKEYWMSQNTKPRPPSVLILALESVSRLHSQRVLPQTRDLLLKNDFVELKGYTKVGENTFPNMGALLSNYPAQTPSCKNKHSTFDDCPYIWQEFNYSNYVTGFLEDVDKYSMFHYNKNGFTYQPTDLYNRPFLQDFYSLQKIKENGYYDHFYCNNGKPLPVTVLDYLEEFLNETTTEKNGIPYFLFYLMGSLSHYDLNYLRHVDPDYYGLLEKLVVQRKYNANNTIIFVMGDHGARLHPFVDTFQGYHEMNLPMLYIWLPPTIRETKPEWLINLKANSHRLVSPFDLYATLEQILTLSIENRNENYSNPNKLESKGLSVFRVIPTNRTCESAQIPDQYCQCGVTPVIKKDGPLAQKLAASIVSTVNEILEPAKNICLPFQVKKIQYAREILVDETKRFVDYSIQVEVKPSAKLRGRFRCFTDLADSANSVKLLGGVERSDKFKDKSECVRHLMFEQYCYCRDYYEEELRQKERKKGKRPEKKTVSKIKETKI